MYFDTNNYVYYAEHSRGKEYNFIDFNPTGY